MVKSTRDFIGFDGLGTLSTYQAGVLQAKANRRVRKITESYLLPYDLTTTQWFAIGLLRDTGNDGMTVTELSMVLGSNLSYATNLLNGLVARSVVTRDTGTTDARNRHMRVHPDFLPKVQSIENDVRQGLRDAIYKSLTPDELTQYMRTLSKFVAL